MSVFQGAADFLRRVGENLYIWLELEQIAV